MKLVLDDGTEIPLKSCDFDDGDVVTDVLVGLSVSNVNDTLGLMHLASSPNSHSATRVGLAHFLTKAVDPYNALGD